MVSRTSFSLVNKTNQDTFFGPVVYWDVIIYIYIFRLLFLPKMTALNYSWELSGKIQSLEWGINNTDEEIVNSWDTVQAEGKSHQSR